MVCPCKVFPLHQKRATDACGLPRHKPSLTDILIQMGCKLFIPLSISILVNTHQGKAKRVTVLNKIETIVFTVLINN